MLPRIQFKSIAVPCGLAVSLLLGACGGDSASSILPEDQKTRFTTPNYELSGNVLRVTNSGISDADGVADVEFTLTGIEGVYKKQNSPVFEQVPKGTYVLTTQARVKNGITGSFMTVPNLNAVKVEVKASIDAPTSLVSPTVAISSEGVITALSTNSSDADGYKVESYTINGQTVTVGTRLPLTPTAQTVTVVENGQAYNLATKSWVPTTVSAQANIAAADPAPTAPAGSAFAGLGDMTVSDELGGSDIVINAGGVIDPSGRAIRYSATGLPAGLSIDPDTGVISGVYDSYANYGQSETFPTTIKATPEGSAKSIQNNFVLSIRNDG